MLATGGVILTTAGSLLISRSLELVKPIEFTHMKIGTGDISSIAQARKLNDLVISYKNINMSTLVRSGDLVRVRGSFTNDEIVETVRIKEVGVFAKIGTEQPILFGYVNDGEGELIPPGTSGIVARTRDLYIGITGEAEVAITINKSLVYSTIEDLEEGLNRKEDKFLKRSGFNLEKTDLTENDSNKVFTPKGALNLFNTLTTNFTNGINAAKEVLRLDIVKKLNKGAYSGDAQDLKNDIDSKLPVNEAYKNYVKDEYIGDTDAAVDSTVIPGKYQCGPNGGKYHLSYLNVIDFFSNHKRQIHHYFANGIQWRDVYNSDFSNVSWNTLWDSLNSPKSHEVENRGDKIFTPLGALNLKNWLVENYTTLMNNIRESLTNMINTKTPHGGYNKSSQDLKNEIDQKLPTRVVKSIINVNQWSSLLDIHRGGTFKVVITYGRGNVVAKGIFLITLGHDNRANIVTLATHDYLIANFSLRIRMKNDRGVLEMLDIANKGAIPENGLQEVNLDIFDVSEGIGFTGYTVFTPPANDGKIACSVETKHGSMYYNNHRLWHTGEFNPDDKENKFSKNSGFNLNKTDLTENDSNKVFTPKGALDLKNWLVTNYTTLMNNIRDTLNNSINTKLNHGGYNSTAQQLKNEIDTKLPFSEAWKLFGKQIGADDSSILNTRVPGNYFFATNTHPKFRVANLEVKALNIFQDHFRQYMYNYDDVTTYVRNVGAGSDTDNPWGAELNTFNVNNFYCPYRVGDIISSTNSANPAATWLGTSWEKLEHCFLYGYNSVGERGGNNAINLTVAQLPPHNMGSNYLRRVGGDGSWDYRPSVSVHPDDASYFNSDTIGAGQAINIMPPYYTVFMWKRIS